MLLSLNLISKDNDKDKDKGKDKDILILTSSREFVNDMFKQSIYGMDFLFSLGEDRTYNKNSSYIDFKIGPFYEKYMQLGYEWGASASIILPSTKKRYRLFFRSLEDNEDNHFNDKSNSSEGNSFVLGLQFVKTSFKYLSSGVSIGARFNTYYPDPLLSFSLKYSIDFGKRWRIDVGDRVYYFLVYKFDNNLFGDLSYIINYKTKIKFYNYYRYREFLNLHEVKNGFGIYYIIQNNMSIKYNIDVLREKDELFSFNIRHYYAGFTFKHIFHSNWLYYEIKPEFYFRESNDFRFSPRILLYLGIIFRAE